MTYFPYLYKKGVIEHMFTLHIRLYHVSMIRMSIKGGRRVHYR